jgi:hypothetical protein
MCREVLDGDSAQIEADLMACMCSVRCVSSDGVSLFSIYHTSCIKYALLQKCVSLRKVRGHRWLHTNNASSLCI